MAHLIDADKLRAEIERRIKESNVRQANLEKIGQVHADIVEAPLRASLKAILYFLDTLQEPKFDLDKLREVAVPLSDEEKDAHRKLMDERRKKYEEMGMLQEPKVDLEKEMEKEIKEHYYDDQDVYWWNYLKNSFRHFYYLGKGDRDTIFHKGMMYYRKQMMEEAVEADIMLTLHDKTGDVSLHTGYLPKSLGIKCDDKVRIIILKEEEP